MPAPAPCETQIELEQVDPPSLTLPSAPVSPMSQHVQGLMAGLKVAVIRLLVSTELSGTVTSKTSPSGAPLFAPRGIAVAFATCLMMGLTTTPFTVACDGAKSDDQLG